MKKRKKQKTAQRNNQTFPKFSLKQDEPKAPLKRENFDSDDPLISGFGGHYGHKSEFKNRKK